MGWIPPRNGQCLGFSGLVHGMDVMILPGSQAHQAAGCKLVHSGTHVMLGHKGPAPHKTQKIVTFQVLKPNNSNTAASGMSGVQPRLMPLPTHGNHQSACMLTGYRLLLVWLLKDMCPLLPDVF
jgi:hypothetical protein